jgi:hypothetical protein
VALVFLWQWIAAYDACRAVGEPSATVCLVGSFYGLAIGWVAAFWLTVILIIERLVP